MQAELHCSRSWLIRRSPPANTGSSGSPTCAKGREEIRLFHHALGALATVNDRQPLGAHKERRIHHAQLLVDLAEDHVEVNGGRRLRHDHHQYVGDLALLEDSVAQGVQRRRRGALAEAHDQKIRAEVVDVATFQRVVAAPLFRAVVQQPGVGQFGMKPEQRLDQQLLGPAHAVSHRADHHMVADHHADVPGEEQVRQRRKGKADFVEGPGDRAALLLGPLDQHLHDLFGRQRAEPLRPARPRGPRPWSC